MQIIIHATNPEKRALIAVSTRFYQLELGLKKSKYNVEIQFKRGLAKRKGMKGCISEIGSRYLLILLDANLKGGALLETLAHEMTHVKQYARGQLRFKKNKAIWLGKKPRKLKYYQRPWEIEAMSKEKVLASKIYSIIHE